LVINLSGKIILRIEEETSGILLANWTLICHLQNLQELLIFRQTLKNEFKLKARIRGEMDVRSIGRSIF